MNRLGSGLYEIKRHLETITDYRPVTEGLREYKARSDPYLEYSIRELVQIWMTAINRFPRQLFEVDCGVKLPTQVVYYDELRWGPERKGMPIEGPYLSTRGPYDARRFMSAIGAKADVRFYQGNL